MVEINQTFLERVFPGVDVQNCLAHTHVAPYEAALNVGLFVLKGVLDDEGSRLWASELEVLFDSQPGPRRTSVQGGRGSKKKYSSIQATTGVCNCFYGYAGTSRHTLKKVREVNVFGKCIDMLNGHIILADSWEWI